MIDRVFRSTKDYEGFEQLCELFRKAKAACIMTDENGKRAFIAPYIYTCSCCGAVIADENWNCVAFTESNVLSVRPISNDYYVYTLELETTGEVYPTQSDIESDKSTVCLSFFALPKGEKTAQEPRSDDESYKAFNIGLNHSFESIYDLETLGWFCDSAMTVFDATSDPDEAMIMLTINERVQDPMSHAVYVNAIEFDGRALTLSAEAENGETLNLCLTPDHVAGVDRIANVNNGFYCVQIELAKRPGEAKPAFLQLGIFL